MEIDRSKVDTQRAAELMRREELRSYIITAGNSRSKFPVLELRIYDGAIAVIDQRKFVDKKYRDKAERISVDVYSRIGTSFIVVKVGERFIVIDLNKTENMEKLIIF